MRKWSLCWSCLESRWYSNDYLLTEVATERCSVGWRNHLAPAFAPSPFSPHLSSLLHWCGSLLSQPWHDFERGRGWVQRPRGITTCKPPYRSRCLPSASPSSYLTPILWTFNRPSRTIISWGLRSHYVSFHFTISRICNGGFFCLILWWPTKTR